MNISIEEFSSLALTAVNPVAIAGRCAVFAESDMIHKQQIGHALSDIAGGLCEALARNYLNNVGKGKELLPPIAFQGGVAANLGMRRAFQKMLGQELIIPRHYDVMGAVGAALLARDQSLAADRPSGFRGWQMCEEEITTSGNACGKCSNNCELVALRYAGRILAYFGDRCGKWSNLSPEVNGQTEVG